MRNLTEPGLATIAMMHLVENEGELVKGDSLVKRLARPSC